jgi:hypothetical protein
MRTGLQFALISLKEERTARRCFFSIMLLGILCSQGVCFAEYREVAVPFIHESAEGLWGIGGHALGYNVIIAHPDNVKVSIEAGNNICMLKLGKITSRMLSSCTRNALFEIITTPGGLGEPDIVEHFYVPITVDFSQTYFEIDNPELVQFELKEGTPGVWRGSYQKDVTLNFKGVVYIGGEERPFDNNLTERFTVNVEIDDDDYPILRVRVWVYIGGGLNVEEITPETAEAFKNETRIASGSVTAQGDLGTSKEYSYNVYLAHFANNFHKPV